jgi:hypothetical protein
MSISVEHIKVSIIVNCEKFMSQRGAIVMMGCLRLSIRVGGPLHCLFGDESANGLSEKKARLHRAVLDPAVTHRVEGGDVLNKCLFEGTLLLSGFASEVVVLVPVGFIMQVGRKRASSLGTAFQLQ